MAVNDLPVTEEHPASEMHTLHYSVPGQMTVDQKAVNIIQQIIDMQNQVCVMMGWTSSCMCNQTHFDVRQQTLIMATIISLRRQIYCQLSIDLKNNHWL